MKAFLKELESQIGPLKTQSEKAEQYLLIRDKLKIYEVNMFLCDSATILELEVVPDVNSIILISSAFISAFVNFLSPLFISSFPFSISSCFFFYLSPLKLSILDFQYFLFLFFLILKCIFLYKI